VAVPYHPPRNDNDRQSIAERKIGKSERSRIGPCGSRGENVDHRQPRFYGVKVLKFACWSVEGFFFHTACNTSGYIRRSGFLWQDDREMLLYCCEIDRSPLVNPRLEISEIALARSPSSQYEVIFPVPLQVTPKSHRWPQ